MADINLRDLFTIFDNDLGAMSDFLCGKTIYTAYVFLGRFPVHTPYVWSEDLTSGGIICDRTHIYVPDATCTVGSRPIPPAQWEKFFVEVDVMDLLGE